MKWFEIIVSINEREKSIHFQGSYDNEEEAKQHTREYLIKNHVNEFEILGVKELVPKYRR